MTEQYFYVTTTLPYVNANPHIGFGLEITEADVIARYHQMTGKRAIFNTGTDEHGQKIYQKAKEQGVGPQTYCDDYASRFKELKELLNIDFTNFTRTTDPHHVKAAQEFWKRAKKNGDIYKAEYEVKYCVGCELEKTDSELDNDKCPLHPNQDLEIRKEENYFFRFSKYQQPLIQLYTQHPEFVKPEGKQKEIMSFVQRGLKDFSISRLKSKMPWGIEVPDDPDHVMYVWFDALVNYISTLGWPEDKVNFDLYWPAVQLAGKDNLRQQSAMWQAMLLSAGLKNSKKILINGFISVGGQKMSKSLGNVISPKEMVKRYGTDATRFLLISLGVFGGDMDVTWGKFDESYTANLANGIGNLCSRVAKMAETSNLHYHSDLTNQKFDSEFTALMKEYELTTALDWINFQVKQADQFLSDTKPWKQVGSVKEITLTKVIDQIQKIVFHLEPFMPEVTETIRHHFQGEVKALKPLFPRVE